MNAHADTRRVLVRAPNWLGDCVMAWPAVAALRVARPGMHLTVLARQPFDQFWSMTGVDDNIPFSIRQGLHGLADRRRLAKRVRAQQFDSAVVLPNSFDSALVPWMAGVPERFGRSRDGRGMLLTQSIAFPRHMRGRHQSRWYAYLVQYWLGEPLFVDYAVRLAPPPDVASRVDEAAAQLRDTLIGINPGATYGPAKRWPAERFAAIAVRACKELNASVILVGGAGDVETCDDVARAIAMQDQSVSSHCRNIAGTTTIAASAAWLQHCRCVVTNDTGGMHLAAVVGTPVVAVFGPTNPGETAPLGAGHRLIVADVPCGPCLERECRLETHRCMESISVDRVWEEVAGALSEA